MYLIKAFVFILVHPVRNRPVDKKTKVFKVKVLKLMADCYQHGACCTAFIWSLKKQRCAIQDFICLHKIPPAWPVNRKTLRARGVWTPECESGCSWLISVCLLWTKQSVEEAWNKANPEHRLAHSHPSPLQRWLCFPERSCRRPRPLCRELWTSSGLPPHRPLIPRRALIQMTWWRTSSVFLWNQSCPSGVGY